MSCPKNSISYNLTRCACGVGQLLNRTSNTCQIFNASPPFILTDEGVDTYAVSFPESIFAFDSIKKFAQSQAVFLEATLVLLLAWLGFCFALRFTKLGDGRNRWFKIRWWISRLDVCFATRHWLDEQQVVKKRKTELGGAFSIASWILFIGLFAALLYQIIAKRTIEVHNIRATNSPDLASFNIDMEFNVTALSSMSCSNLRGIGNLVTGNPGFTDNQVSSLSSFVSYSCLNTTLGPTLSFKCSNCRINHEYMYISWQYVDLADTPASAVGFQFNLTSKNLVNKRHVSFVSGTVKNGSTLDGRPVTFRGINSNILKFNLFPRIYHYLDDLRLVQPVFHEFVPGSNYGDAAQLQASLERSSEGLVNTTLFIDYLSAYIVEIDQRSILSPVSFLADLGGLYCISISIFFYFLVQFEYRIKRLRHEDGIMRKTRSRSKAQLHWDKLRKYVMYTWGHNTLDGEIDHYEKALGCCCNGNESAMKRKQLNRKDTISFSMNANLPSRKTRTPATSQTQEVQSFKADTASIPKITFSNPTSEPNVKDGNVGLTSDGDKICDSPNHKKTIPLPPPVEFETGSEVEMSDIQKNFQLLYNYNLMLREKLVATESSLHALTVKLSPPGAEG